MSRSAYSKWKCWICGKRISAAGFAQYQHRMMHVRRWEMKRLKHHVHGYDYYTWKITEKGHKARKRRLWKEEQNQKGE